MTRTLMRLVWTNRGLRRFEREVNTALAVGWSVVGIELTKPGLRTLCCAVLSKEEPCACECSCCADHDPTCCCKCLCCREHRQTSCYHED